MDPFAIGVVVVVATAILASCLAARASAGKHLEFGAARRDPRRPTDLESARDAEDLQEMLAVTNARRRARGLPERSLADAIREFGGE